MNSENVTAWATAVTAIGALALIGVTIWVEYSRRRHERAQLHLQQLRDLLFEPLRQQIIGHYLPILERQDGLIRLDTREQSSTYDPLHGKTIEWTLQLVVKSASPSIGWTVGEHQRIADYDATFPHLYQDAKTAHFPELFKRWEHFQERVQQLGKESLAQCLSWQHQLEKQRPLPVRENISTSLPWCNYVALSQYVYEQLWRSHPNGAGSFQESGCWVIRFDNYDLARGEQKDLAVCLEAVAKLVRTESVAGLITLADQVKVEGIALKEEFERLMLTQLPLGSCPLIRVPRF